jgi:hypothetical protein
MLLIGEVRQRDSLVFDLEETYRVIKKPKAGKDAAISPNVTSSWVYASRYGKCPVDN